MKEKEDLKLKERVGLKIYYDGECGFCRNTVYSIKNKFLLPEAQIYPAQDKKDTEADMKKYNSWVVIDYKGNKYYKFEAVIYVTSLSPRFFFLSHFFKLGLIRFLGEKIYEKVAENRSLISSSTKCSISRK
jgi:predicted DCC family thiol-disulfide oxidoreductase YuxK